MNDIFDSSNVFAVDILGQASYTLLQYNLFYNNINTHDDAPVDREREQYDQPSGTSLAISSRSSAIPISSTHLLVISSSSRIRRRSTRLGAKSDPYRQPTRSIRL